MLGWTSGMRPILPGGPGPWMWALRAEARRSAVCDLNVPWGQMWELEPWPQQWSCASLWDWTDGVREGEPTLAPAGWGGGGTCALPAHVLTSLCYLTSHSHLVDCSLWSLLRLTLRSFCPCRRTCVICAWHSIAQLSPGPPCLCSCEE